MTARKKNAHKTTKSKRYETKPKLEPNNPIPSGGNKTRGQT